MIPLLDDGGLRRPAPVRRGAPSGAKLPSEMRHTYMRDCYVLEACFTTPERGPPEASGFAHQDGPRDRDRSHPLPLRWIRAARGNPLSGLRGDSLLPGPQWTHFRQPIRPAVPLTQDKPDVEK